MNAQARQCIQSRAAVVNVMHLAMNFLAVAEMAALIDPRIDTFLCAEMRRLAKGTTT